jgi:quinol monooxygenase YgiN
MISFIVRMKFRSDDRERVAELLKGLAMASRQEPGCVHYVPHTIDGEADTVVIYEQYADQKAVEAHRGSPHFRDMVVGGLYQMMLDRQMENLVAVA